MKTLKIAIVAVALLTATVSAQAETTGDSMAGVGGYSEGYRMGKITKYSTKGWAMKSGEGEIHMGKDSDVWQVKTKEGVETKNPWAFSNSAAAADIVSKYQGKYVWVKYQQAMFTLPNRDTSYTVVEVTPVSRETPACKAESGEKGWKSNGARTGRIVKASSKGALLKTWEIDIHMGGRNFLSMSTNDEAIYNCAIEWLKSGKEVNIHYAQKAFDFSLNDTDYRIVKIEGADDL